MKRVILTCLLCFVLAESLLISPVIQIPTIKLEYVAQGSTLPATSMYPKSSDNLDTKLEDLARQIAREMSEYQKRVIAVVEFVDLEGRVTNFGRFIAEELTMRMLQTRKFKVIERQMLSKIIAEQKLVLTGAFEPSSAQRLGKLLGVDSICSGSVTELARSLRVNARLISAETGEIFAGASAEFAKDESVLKLLGGGMPDIVLPTETDKKISIKTNLFTFELQQCVKSGTTVICDFIITNHDTDRSLTFGRGVHSSLFDDQGNKAEPNQVQIANQSGRQDATINIISGIPTTARMGFEGISPRSSKISVLNIQCASIDNSQYHVFDVQFRDIPMKK